MRILTIDPGSKLGWATNATGRLEWGTEDFRIKAGESSGNRWRRFGQWLNDVSLTDERDSLAAQCAGRKIELIVYEKSHFPSSARYAADVAAGFTTRLEEHCERHGIALQPVAVQTLKAFAIPRVARKKGDPRMDRGKAAMIYAARARLVMPPAKSLDDISSMRGSQDFSALNTLTEHEADALWLHWYAEREFSR